VLLGTCGLAVGLAAGGLVLVATLRYALERTADAAASQTARDVAALVRADRLPNPVPAGGTTVVQVVDGAGRVRAASAGGDRLVPALSAEELRRVVEGERRYLPGDRFGVDGVVRVVAVPATTDVPVAERQTVVVAAPAGDIDDSVRVVRTALLVGYAVLLALLAAVAWRIVGATLRPVEQLRRGAEEITGAGSAARLPLPASRDEIHLLATTLNGMLARLDASTARQRAFVADAAHELRSPLASLRTQLEVAVATGTTADPDDLLADVERLTRLVGDLLLLARMEDGAPLDRRREPVDLLAVARDAVTRIAPTRVPVTVAGTPATVAGDPDVLARMVANLVENAVRYARSGVSVRVAENGAEAVLTVADDGPGIPAADRDRVFDRFTRLDDARDRGSGGTGLGLAIVREGVRRHGGTVTLGEADPSPGLVVTVGLPAP
jgi:signal transduction histidine kinase